MRIAAAGGTPIAITSIDGDKVTHRLPFFLPRGTRLLYTRGQESLLDRRSKIMLLDLGTGESTELLKESSQAFYSPPGYLIFLRGTNLMAQRFDADIGAVSGEAVVIAEHVEMNINRFMGAVSVSPGGALIYKPAAALRRLEWIDVDGRSLGAFGEPADFAFVEIAPGGDSVAATIRRADGRFDMWLCDTVRGTRSRLIEDVGNDGAAWSPDASRLSYGNQAVRCCIREVGGAEKQIDLTGGWPTDWSRDGKLLAIGRQERSTYLDIHLIDPNGGEARPFRVSSGREQFGTFSPDGAWLAYVSDGAGREEVVIAPVSGAGAAIPVAPTSSSYATQGLWWLDDGTLIYFGPSGRTLVALPVTFKVGVPQLGAPKLAFGGLEIPSDILDISPDGKRMLVAVPLNKGGTDSLILVQSWPSGIAPAR